MVAERAMIMPAMLLVLMISGMLAGTLATVGALATRGQRRLESDLRVQWAIEEGVALAMSRWATARIAERPLGEVEVVDVTTASGQAVHVARRRTHPLIMQVMAASGGRHQVTWVWLAPPPLAVTPGHDPLTANDSGSTRWSVMATITDRARSQRPTEEAMSQWSLFHGPADRFAGGPTDFAGLAVIQGDLHVQRPMRLRGLLVVHGVIDCAGGAITIQGGLIHVTAKGTPSADVSCLDVHADRMALEEALAFVAVPRRAPFHLRHWPAAGPS
jgi:hypothetical protein